MNLDSADLA